ncbi:hypothetical protein AIOL_001223 [Candidatus Rhodobacter oscarellae]|uniref:Uncharacterized protein n=1 Tax=Candidatus Rhodobacter oscarellae TaxID=1675527 RepID=A0A0J9E011_9RHOB|nr:hypothetical protein [Candidatus Rhodobacter lobularis]KMW56271.1 hypothetical protein AIOL_001223 [Candidatus Rhodobacter lobularis]
MGYWIVTYRRGLDLEELRACLAEIGAHLVEGAEPIPLSDQELSIEITTERGALDRIEAIDGVQGVFPSSDMSTF